MSDLLKRRGFLKLTTSIFLEDAENIAKAFGELCFIPTRVEHRFDRNEFHLNGISHAFDLVEDCFLSPEYFLFLEVDENGKYKSSKLKKI